MGVEQVYNRIASYKNVGCSLPKIGGPERPAEKGSVFIERADGNVASCRPGAWRFGNLVVIADYAGDTRTGVIS